ncbi:MAG: prenyltransferase/squalene oxidase repeat-containing protein [Planctomycetota bacterium]|nr:prenyltransferase/squalene oxidase repeat-containing protein [Planctomycetota bacterium]
MAEEQQPVVAKCPACGAAYKLPASAAGKRFACKKCQSPITVPAVPTAPAASSGQPAKLAPPKTGTSPRIGKPSAPVSGKADLTANKKTLPTSRAAVSRGARAGIEKKPSATKVTEPDAKPSPKRSQKKVLLALVCFVLVLVGGGVGGYFYLDSVRRQSETERKELDRISALLKEGEDLMSKRDYAAAAERFKLVTESKSRARWDGVYCRGKLAFVQGRYESALSDSTEAIEGNKAESSPATFAAETYFLRARARVALGQYSDAVADIEAGLAFKQIAPEIQTVSDKLKQMIDINNRAIATLQEKQQLFPVSQTASAASPDFFEQCIGIDAWEPTAQPTFRATQPPVRPDPQVARPQWPTALVPLPAHAFLGDLAAVLRNELGNGLKAIALPVNLADGRLGMVSCLLHAPETYKSIRASDPGPARLCLTVSKIAGRLTITLADAAGKSLAPVESLEALPAAVDSKRPAAAADPASPAAQPAAESSSLLLLTLDGFFSAQEFVNVLDACRKCERVEPSYCVDTQIAMQGSLLAGLGWLARHQNADGGWDAEKFDTRCKKKDDLCPGRGREENNEACTAFALLAFLGSGFDAVDPADKGDARFEAVVKGAKESLSKLQKDDGCFEPKAGRQANRLVFIHALVTAALAEAVIGGDTKLKDRVDKAADFLLDAQSPGGGWGYKPKDEHADAITTGWAVVAIRAAQATGKAVDQQKLEGALEFLKKLTDSREFKVFYREDQQIARYAENAKFNPQRAPVSHALIARLVVTGDTRAPTVVAAGNLLVQRLPVWDKIENIDLYHWMLGTAGLYLLEGRDSASERKSWLSWTGALAPILLERQNREAGTCLDGSWDATDKWGWAGGRPYSTAACALTMATILGEEGFVRRLAK